FHDGFSQLKALGKVSGVRLDLSRRQGPPRAVLWSSRVVYKPDGKFAATRGTLFDISERNILEAQRNTLASLITHDIKNHLVAESILLDIVLRDKHTLLTESDRNLLDVMRDNNYQFLKVTNNLLELYRLEKTGYAAPVADTDLAAMLKQVCQLSEAGAHTKGVKLVTEIDEQVPTVSVNPLGMHHAIYNLVDNGIKFSPSGGKLLLSLKQEGDVVVIKVCDGGPGLTADEQSKLFAAPWSMSWEGSQQMSSGLGLYLSKQIVDSQ